jgi:vancomycin resistance protein YoaR
MDAFRQVQPRNLFPIPSARHLIVALISTILVFIFASVTLIIGVRVVYAGQAFPGVHSMGISLSGLNSIEIKETLERNIVYPETGLIVLHDVERLWSPHPNEVGVAIDFNEMERLAMAVGRQGSIAQQVRGQLQAWVSGVVVTPIVVFDQQQASNYLSQVAEEIDLPQIEATIGVDGFDILMRPGQIGRRVDIQSTLELLLEPVSHLYDAQIDLIVEELPPIVLDTSEQASLAREILSEPLVLTADDNSWTFELNTLAGLLTFNLIETESGAEYSVGLSTEALDTFLRPLAEELDILAQNPRFIFNDDTAELDLLESAVTGRQLDIDETIERINTDLTAGRHEIPLVFNQTEPEISDDATAEDLGISAPVSVVSSYFSGSGSARAQNVATASAAFHGMLVAPGETLSMAEVLGDISLDTGYAEALIIYGDRTIKGVGGGVCQVSTTLFRAAFFGGYPLVERHPHAYRVRYYELGSSSPGPGFDATVFVPVVDFKFTNDRDSWLLLETYISGSQLIWKFYSSPDAREVQWSSQQSNHVDAPEDLYKENADLPKGKIKQVDWSADGLDVLVTRTVTLDGDILYDDEIKTHYLPWRAIYEYGPETKLPEDARTEATEDA